jgi:hypothetical protein
MAVAIRKVGTKRAAQQAPVLANKRLISDQLWTRLVNRIVKDEKVELAMAERIWIRLWASSHYVHRTPDTNRSLHPPK